MNLRTYANYERDERLPDAEFLAKLVEEGWNANWLLTGEGPERLDDSTGALSQDLSEEGLTVALEMTDEVIRAEGVRYVPRALYARLLKLLYDGYTQGLPVAEIYDAASLFAEKITKNRGNSDDREQGVGRAVPGRDQRTKAG